MSTAASPSLTWLTHSIPRTDQGEWERAVDILRNSLRGDSNLLRWFDDSQARSWHGNTSQRTTTASRLWPEGWLDLNADDFGATDVLGAAQLCEKILGFVGNG